jgi:hypothetical protein
MNGASHDTARALRRLHSRARLPKEPSAAELLERQRQREPRRCLCENVFTPRNRRQVRCPECIAEGARYCWTK